MKYFSLFSGIGGFELGILYSQQTYDTKYGSKEEELAWGREYNNKDMSKFDSSKRLSCIGFSEIDKYATQIYKKHFPEHKEYGDVSKIDWTIVPDFDLLVGGFPCQAFSIAGKRGGFDDTRGTLFFEIARCLKQKRPRLCLLENVKGLLSHDKGSTFFTILATLDELGYDLQWQVLNSKNFGVPQNRERVFIVGQKKNTRQIPVFPLEYKLKEDAYEIQREEKVYLLSKGISKDIGAFLTDIPFTEKKQVSKQQMQRLLTNLKQGIQKEECREIEREPQKIRQQSEGDIQEVKTIGSFLESANDSRGICGVVQIPTEEVLLLWDRGQPVEIGFRQIQQQDLSFDCGQDRLVKGLSTREHSTLLLAVQPYQGRLFYSVGNGRDWKNIYISEVENKCNPTLKCILEEQVDQKYFLSEEKTQSLVLKLEQSKL